MGVTVAAAWIIFGAIDWAHLWQSLVNASPLLLALAVPVLTIQFAVMVKRWQITIAILGGVPVGFAPLAIGLARSMLIGQPLPSTLGGDVVRAVELSGMIGLNLAALVLLVVVCLPFFALLIGAGIAFWALACVALGALVAMLLTLFQTGRIARWTWLGGHPAAIAADIRHVLQARPDGLTLLYLSFTTHLLGVLLIYTLGNAVGAPMSLVQSLLVVPPTLLISAIPISLGGWGVREGTLAAGFALIGLSTEAGVATSILFGLTGPLIGLVAELAVVVMRGGRSAAGGVT
jgi:uncharacterized membrane protein YbhN (UPF0104 family)